MRSVTDILVKVVFAAVFELLHDLNSNNYNNYALAWYQRYKFVSYSLKSQPKQISQWFGPGVAWSREKSYNFLLICRRALTGGILDGNACLVPYHGRSEYAGWQNKSSYFGVNWKAWWDVQARMHGFQVRSLPQSFHWYGQSTRIYQLLIDMIVRRIKIYAKITKHRILRGRWGEIATHMERELPEKSI